MSDSDIQPQSPSSAKSVRPRDCLLLCTLRAAHSAPAALPVVPAPYSLVQMLRFSNPAKMIIGHCRVRVPDLHGKMERLENEKVCTPVTTLIRESVYACHHPNTAGSILWYCQKTKTKTSVWPHKSLTSWKKKKKQTKGTVRVIWGCYGFLMSSGADAETGDKGFECRLARMRRRGR